MIQDNLGDWEVVHTFNPPLYDWERSLGPLPSTSSIYRLKVSGVDSYPNQKILIRHRIMPNEELQAKSIYPKEDNFVIFHPLPEELVELVELNPSLDLRMEVMAIKDGQPPHPSFSVEVQQRVTPFLSTNKRIAQLHSEVEVLKALLQEQVPIIESVSSQTLNYVDGFQSTINDYATLLPEINKVLIELKRSFNID